MHENIEINLSQGADLNANYFWSNYGRHSAFTFSVASCCLLLVVGLFLVETLFLYGIYLLYLAIIWVKSCYPILFLSKQRKEKESKIPYAALHKYNAKEHDLKF